MRRPRLKLFTTDELRERLRRELAANPGLRGARGDPPETPSREDPRADPPPGPDPKDER